MCESLYSRYISYLDKPSDKENHVMVAIVVVPTKIYQKFNWVYHSLLFWFAGALWWDSKGTSGVSKPKFFRIKTTGGSVVKDINILNCPVQCVSINTASDTVIDNFYIDVSDGDSVSYFKSFVTQNQFICLWLKLISEKWCSFHRVSYISLIPSDFLAVSLLEIHNSINLIV